MSQRIRVSNNTSLRDRSALLGSAADHSSSSHSLYARPVTPPFSGRSSPFGYNDTSGSNSYGYNSHGPGGSGGLKGHTEPSGHRYADDLEGQNDEALEGLIGKVKVLKDLTIGIGNEVRESTKQLSQMNDAFTETGGILLGTFRRMNNMAARQGCRWIWYIVFLIIVFWIFIVVWWFRR